METINETPVKKSKMKTLWSKNDVIIALLFAKFSLRKVGISDDETEIEYFANEYIGSNYYSLTMEANNLKNVLNDKHNAALDNPYDHTSKTQKEVVEQYDSYNEYDLAVVVNNILDQTTEEEKTANLSNIDPNIFKNRMKERVEKDAQRLEDKREREVLKCQKENKCIVTVVKSNKRYYISGDVIKHKMHGEGLIKDVDGKKVTIDFNKTGLGIKTMFFNEEYFSLV